MAQWRALPLVFSVSSENRATLHVSSDARDALLSIHTQTIGVLGVFGPPASGKRLLLKTMLQPHDVDFSSSPEDRNNVFLWIWLPKDGAMKADGKARVVLAAGAALETENRQHTEDQKLALLLLLSSSLLYNADGEIDGKAVERLQWLEKVAQVLRVKAMQDEEAVASEFREHAPKFIWLARNFKIKWLKNAEGQKLTPMQYFEQCLAPEGGYGEAATKRNKLRTFLESFFPARDCVALSRAMEGSGTEIVSLETPRSELRKQFVEAVDEVYVNYLSEKGQQLPSKTLMGHELRSEHFVAVLDTYVDAINTEQLPTMQNASNSLLEQEITEAFQGATQIYAKEMEKQSNDGKAISERDIYIAHFRGVQAATTHTREVCLSLPERLQKRLFKDSMADWETQVKHDVKGTLEHSTKLSTKICTKTLERVLPQNLEAMCTQLAERL
ncbi:hypothetical protein PHMEG_00019848 [Phytophthora megakarya]|uniref:Guanylate-binding protein N-terminal domain-containing protein n=1 Tax=Phytophthora megakarya TaxID=4795 RepID=A0A225VSH4_9STRA|nr:hypothetical protein PHMEG_00019848 [Phytophthora megakarya]